MKIYYVSGIPYSDELYHYGILGQKWGVRRFENPDGTLTPAGKERYNRDSDFVAQGVANKYKAVRRLSLAKNNAEQRLLKDPKSFSNSEERKDYVDSVLDAQSVFRRYQNLIKKIEKKYSDISVDVLTENGTGEQYARAVLSSKTGETYISEFYLGAKVDGK